METTALSLITLLLISILGLVLAIVAYSYRQLIKKYYLLKELADKDKKHAEEEAAKLVEEARAEAKQIITTATSLNQKFKDDVASALSAAANTQSSNYKLIEESLRSESIKMLDNMSKNISQELNQEIKKFSTSAISAMQKDLLEYKKSREKEIDSNIQVLIARVAKEVIGKTLNLEDHEDLVIKALSEAKEQNLI